MLLSKLEINGFKSFAHKAGLEFPDILEKGNKRGMSVIVGPNGSGKSNITEAIRWVLGEQSMKVLRGKKGEDVIFSGSDKKTRLGYAEVSLYLDNSDRKAPIDFSEIVITRKIYRSGESEYYINKSKVRLQDILMLLAKSRFGQRSYSIIGQGMVDSILIMSQAEKKDFFDEAAGIKEFQIKRDSALNKLRRTEDNLNQADVLLTEISPRLRSLTRQVKKLERREAIEKDLYENQLDYFTNLWHENTHEYEEINTKFKKIDEERKLKEEQTKTIEAELNKFQQAVPRTEAFELLQKEYQKLLAQKTKLREDELNLKNQFQLLSHSKPAKAQDVPLEEVLAELESLLVMLSGSGDISELDQLKEKMNTLEQKLSGLIKKIKKPGANHVDEEANQIKASLEKLQAKLKEADQSITNAQEKINNFNKVEEQKNKAFFDLQKDFQTAQNEFNKLVSVANEHKVELARLETKKEDLEIEVKEELEDPNLIHDKNRIKTINYPEAQAEIQRLKHQLELIGGIDPEVQKEYEETKERHDFLFKQVADLKDSLKSLEKIIHDLDDTIKKQFDQSFNLINSEFQKYFKTLFSGGQAKLIKITAKDKEDEKTEAQKAMEQIQAEKQASETDPTTEEELEEEPKKKSVFDKLKVTTITGVEIQATPPGKKLKSISMLSGGERAMTAIALICSIISCNPSPFIVLDEVDAALDEANSERFANILDELSHKTQFVVVTHNRATMHRAKILYGVTMGDDGVSKVLSLKLEEAEKYER